MIEIAALVLSIIAIGFGGYLYFTKYMYNKNTDKTLRDISRLAQELADNVPQDLKGELDALRNVGNKALGGVLSLVNIVNTNNKHYLKIALDDKYLVGKYRENIPTVFNALTNSLISIEKVKISPNSIYVSIPFGSLSINTETGEVKSSGEFTKFDMKFLEEKGLV